MHLDVFVDNRGIFFDVSVKPDRNADANASISVKGETCRPVPSTEEVKIEDKR